MGAGLSQRTHVVGLECQERLLDTFVQAAVRQKLAEGMSGSGKAAGYPYTEPTRRIPSWKMRNHFAETGVFPADRLDITHPQ